MKCSNCGFENPEKSKYCGKCGKALKKIKVTNIMILFFILIIGILGYQLLAVPTEDNKNDDKRTPDPTTTVMPTTASPVPTTVIPTGTTSNINVSTPGLAEIIISPSTLSILTGQTRKFYSVSKDEFGKPVDSTITWTSSNPDVGAIDSQGLFTAISSGTTIITAASRTISRTATVKVFSPPELIKIIVSPSAASVESGKTQNFMASPRDQYDQPIEAAISWTSSDQSVGTIDSNGVFTSIAPGTTTITAASKTVRGTAIMTVTISPPELNTIIVYPSDVSVEVGQNQNFQASPRDKYDQPISATISWTSSNPRIGTIDSSGLFTAKSSGTTTITATSGTFSGTATVTVPPIPVLTTITVSPSTASVIVGKTENFYFSPEDQFGTFIETTVVWSSSDTKVGTIDHNGVFSAKTSGKTKVSAVNGNVIGSASVSVIRDPTQPLTPQLSFVGSESYTVNSRTFLRYRLNIDNWNDFPPELFDVAPDLPPCGLNKNAARTWVNIYYSINNNYIYGFCALSSPQDLTSIWFALEQGSTPASGVYVELEDRRINKKYRSNTVSVN